LGAFLEAFFIRIWQSRGIVACLFWPLALLFSGLLRLRRWFFSLGLLKSVALPVPVLVVGNIFVGGTGKTPLTLALVQALRVAGWVPGVVSRGFGGKHGDAVLAVLADSSPALVGDEPVLIAQRGHCPVFVGRNRAAAGQALLAAHPQVNIIISDDGLQHYALQRQCEVMLFDQRGVGNGWLLPAGPLREPASRRADCVVCNVGNVGSVGSVDEGAVPADLLRRWPQISRMVLQSELAFQLVQPQQQQALDKFTGNGMAAAGIGHPERFFAMLRARGVSFTAMPLPDHFSFDPNPFADVCADWILITEKDAVKCRQTEALRNDPRLWVVPVSAQLEPALIQSIVEKCGGYPIT
jgi:tetraacyldisaccharide 4'-kinase